MTGFTTFPRRRIFAALVVFPALFIAASPWMLAQRAVAQSDTVGERGFINKGLVGVGRLPADLRDKFR